jgi:hypothetical protein
MISYSSDPSRSSTEFILPRGEIIDFYPDHPRSTAPIPLSRGYFLAFERRPIELSNPAMYSVACVRGESELNLEDATAGRGSAPPISNLVPTERPGGIPMEPARPPENIPETDSSIREPFLKKAGEPPAKPPGSPVELLPGAASTADPPGKSIAGIFPGGTEAADPAAGKGIAKVFPPKASGETRAGADSPMPANPGDPSGPPTGPGRKDLAPKEPGAFAKAGAAPLGLICDAETGDAKTPPRDMKFTSLQTVGVRNAARLAKGYDYLVIGDALPLDRETDVADSASKLVPYEAVAMLRGGSPNQLLISIAGTESRTKPPEGAPKPGKTLRILVAGGAAELAISGLELIDGPLNASGKDRIGLDIEWQLINETGSIKQVGQYSSFGALVKAAAATNAERPDVLDEEDILRLLNAIEGLLQTRKVDRVFWIKGAYPISSSIPQQLEKFLVSVSSSSSVPHTPAGQATRWFQIVTARMPGFSIAYLKEPVNSLQAGEVLEESSASVTSARRLISAEDANVLASKLRSGLSLTPAATRPGVDTPADRSTLAGKLVLDASELFVERGYFLSADSAVTLQKLLQQVPNLWDASGELKEGVLRDFATRSGRAQPTLADVLQMGDSKDYPRLPRTLPEWSRKPLKGLSLDETDRARALVTEYAQRVSQFLEKARKPAASVASNCGLYYVSEASLGFK